MELSRRNLLKSASLSAALATMAQSCARQELQETDELAALDAVETAARIRAGDLTAEEAVEAAIARAERIDPKINAIVSKNYKRARADAERALSGPLAGVPTFIKDLDDVIGLPTRFGSRAFPGYRGKEQTDLINAYFGLGVISIGKSATPEFGLTATTEPKSGGASRNPWNLGHSTGGSSGGAAALVAAGVTPIAHASDGGGSIRIPASCCGTVGLKVSRGRNPEARPSPGPIVISEHGCESRTVRDTAAVIAGIEAPVSGMDRVGLVTGPNTRRLKIGVLIESPAERPINPDVVSATQSVAELCAGLGHEIVDAAVPLDPSVGDDFTLYWASMAEKILATWEEATNLPRNGLAFEQFTLGLAEHFSAQRDKYDGAVARLQQTPAQFGAMFDDIDILLSPVVAAPPPEIGYLRTDVDYEATMERLLDYVQYTAIYNMTGAPAISLPLSMSPGGLPIGAMFGARQGDERTLLELAFELEEAAPWAARRPEVFG